jgi:hypothetical protein
MEKETTIDSDHNIDAVRAEFGGANAHSPAYFECSALGSREAVG